MKLRVGTFREDWSWIKKHRIWTAVTIAYLAALWLCNVGWGLNLSMFYLTFSVGYIVGARSSR